MTTPAADTRDATNGLLSRLFEAPALLAAVTCLALLGLWLVTFELADEALDNASRTTAAAVIDVADTYEAQVVRSLREIDQALKLVRFEIQRRQPEAALAALNEGDLLPPSLLFALAVFDGDGQQLAARGQFQLADPASWEFFQRALKEGRLTLSEPVEAQEGAFLYFARPAAASSAGVSRVVVLGVRADYFVSGYDEADFGQRGVLGLVGDDGRFRVRRSGDEIRYGVPLGIEVIAEPDAASSSQAAPLVFHALDDTARFTVLRELFDFPLSVAIGLAREEQLAPAYATEHYLYWRALVISLVLLTLATVLGRMSGRLQRARRRAVQERIEHASQVEYLAFHDSLTGLPNRAHFSRLLHQGMAEARRYERQFALLFLDLDRFKNINDSLGHDAGDELLQEIARRLSAAVRDSDIVARLGGDEFVVLLPQISDADLQVVPVAKKILAACARPFMLVGQEFRVTVSIGITLYPRDGDDEQILMKHADLAMYRAKELGKNTFQFFSSTLSEDSLERMALESSLRDALDRDEFALYYQPKRTMQDGAITGVEALLRWHHPTLGTILPMKFIPMAEENGLIVPIGRWVLRTACQQCADWESQGVGPLNMAVNLSPRQFVDENLLDDVREALSASGMPAQRLEIEITESMVMRDPEATIRILGELRDLGVRVAIDDFGSGYSSLAKLSQFPLDTIKIDASFINDPGRSAEDQGLTEAVIALGRRLSLNVMAEGVETEQQHHFLRDNACNEFQGFYANEALPADALARLLAK